MNLAKQPLRYNLMDLELHELRAIKRALETELKYLYADRPEPDTSTSRALLNTIQAELG